MIAGGELGLRAGQCVPEDVVEQLAKHRLGFNASAASKRFRLTHSPGLQTQKRGPGRSTEQRKPLG